jgi:chromosome segregation ATPase
MSNRVQLFESISSLDQQGITWEAVRKRREQLGAIEAQKRSADIQEFEKRAGLVVQKARSLRARIQDNHARMMGTIGELEGEILGEGRALHEEISSLELKMDIPQEIAKREPESTEEWSALQRICQNVEATIGAKSDTAMQRRLLQTCVQRMEMDCLKAKEKIAQEIVNLEKAIAASTGVIEKLSSEIKEIERQQKELKVGLDDLKIQQIENERLIAVAKKAAEEKKREVDKKRKQLIKTMQIATQVAASIAVTWVATQYLKLPVTFRIVK